MPQIASDKLLQFIEDLRAYFYLQDITEEVLGGNPDFPDEPPILRWTQDKEVNGGDLVEWIGDQMASMGLVPVDEYPSDADAPAPHVDDPVVLQTNAPRKALK